MAVETSSAESEMTCIKSPLRIKSKKYILAGLSCVSSIHSLKSHDIYEHEVANNLIEVSDSKQS